MRQPSVLIFIIYLKIIISPPALGRSYLLYFCEQLYSVEENPREYINITTKLNHLTSAIFQVTTSQSPVS